MDAFLTALEHHPSTCIGLGLFVLMLAEILTSITIRLKLPERSRGFLHKIETGE